MKTKAFRIYKAGGPSVLKWETVDVPAPGEREVLIRHKVIGLNLADTYRRKGIYKMPMPNGLGNEAVGVIELIAKGVRGFKVGDRVGYIGGSPFDAYSQKRIARADNLISLPDSVSDRIAAAALLKGITAQYLLNDAYRVKKSDTILIHAAAGGVGAIMCQWANHLGAKVIGIVSSEDKAKFAKRNGCHHTIVTRKPSFSKHIKEITNGKGVNVVYDSVGKLTWDESLSSLRLRGTMISFGSASGEPPSVNISATGALGSPFLARCALVNYTTSRRELLDRARSLFSVIGNNVVKVSIKQRYPLAEAPQAQKDMESRKTTGSTILLP